MAQRNLRYYRGQYNPSSQGSYNPDIISMYRPEEEMILSEAARGRQQRFDVGKASISQEIARIGDLDTVDYEQMKNRLSDFEEKVNTTVQDKYSGDYGAAANEITKLIAKERTHPFYTFNKQKVKAAEQFQEDARRLGADFMPTNNPSEVSYSDWKQGADMTYTPVNRSQIVAASQNMFQNLSKTMQNDPQLASTAGGQYFLAMMQNGASSPAEVMDFLQTDIGQNMVNQITQSMPELQQLDQEAVMGAISQGAMSMIGQNRSQFLSDKNFISDLDKAKLAAAQGEPVGNKITREGFMKSPIDIKQFEEDPYYGPVRDDAAQEVADKYNIPDIESYQDLQNLSQIRDDYLNAGITGSAAVVFDKQPENIATFLKSRFQKYTDKEFRTQLKQARQAVNEIESQIENDELNLAFPVYNLNRVYSAATSGDSEIENNITALNELIDNSKQYLVGYDKKSQNALEDITEDLKVVGFSYEEPTSADVNPRMILQIEGLDKDDAEQKSLVYVKEGAYGDKYNQINDYLLRLDEATMGGIFKGLYNE